MNRVVKSGAAAILWAGFFVTAQDIPLEKPVRPSEVSAEIAKAQDAVELHEAILNTHEVLSGSIGRSVRANGFAVAFSHDGKYLAAGSKIHRVSDWSVVRSFEGIANPAKVLFSSDDQHLFVGESDFSKPRGWLKPGFGGMWKLDIKTGDKSELKDAEGEKVWILSASADGKTVMRIKGGKLQIDELPQWKPLNSMVIGDGFAPVLSANGKRTIRDDGWATVNVGVVDDNWANWFNQANISSLCPAFTPDGKRLIVSTKSGNVTQFQVMDLEKECEQIAAATWKGDPNSFGSNECVEMAVAPDGKTLAALFRDQSVVTAMLPDLRLFRLIKRGGSSIESNRYTGGATALAFSPDGNWLAVGGEDGRFTLLDARKFRSPSEIHGHASDIVDAFFSNDGRVIRTVDSQGKGCVWDAKTLSLKNEYLLPYGYFLLHASEDGENMVCGTDSLLDSFSDGDDGWLVSKVNWPLNIRQYNVQWIDKNTAVVSDSTNICVYDISTGKIVSKAMAPKPLPVRGYLSGDSKSLLFFTQKAHGEKIVIQKADLKTAVLADVGVIETDQLPTDSISLAGLIPGGRQIYVFNQGMTIFDLETLKPVSRKCFQSDNLEPFAFSRDGKQYAVQDANPKTNAKLIRIQDVKTARTIMAFAFKGPGVKSLRFSADGGRLLGVDADGDVRIWNLQN